jgi:hypothetical protein
MRGRGWLAMVDGPWWMVKWLWWMVMVDGGATVTMPRWLWYKAHSMRSMVFAQCSRFVRLSRARMNREQKANYAWVTGAAWWMGDGLW